MKKRLFILSATMLLTLASCGGTPASSSTPASEPKTDTSQPAGTTGDAGQSQGQTSQDTPSGTHPEYGLPYFSDDVVTEPSIVIHYFTLDGNYDDTSIWCWKKDDGGDQYFFEYVDTEHGEHIAVIPLSAMSGSPTLNDTFGIIFRAVAGWSWQTKDLIVDFSDFDLVGQNAKHVYFMKDDDTPRKEGLYVRADLITVCNFISEERIRVETSNPVDHYWLYINGEVALQADVDQTKSPKLVVVYLTDIGPDTKVDLAKSYEIECRFTETQDKVRQKVAFDGLYGTSAFNDNYTYDGDDLGVTLGQDNSVFKAWSPVSTSIDVRIYDNGTPLSVDAVNGSDTYQSYPMALGEKGVFSATVPGNLNGKYYTYFVKNEAYPLGIEIVDPYAKSCGVNGLRGQVLDLSTTNPNGWELVEPINYDRKGLVVYESHLVDPTMSDTWSDNPSDSSIKGTYAAFHKGGTTHTKGDKTINTGFDHILGLNVNAIQLQPIYDQANDEVHKSFNWGYNPLNYNCLEGSYSSDPYHGEVRIREFKELIADCNDYGINVIMDVVYNHVNSVTGQNFDVLMPKYYFRYNADGSLSNGSGCGNETASDRKMFSKFMIDSATFWAKEYKLGGFRFDLMGLHDLETMKNLTAKVRAETFDNFTIYGEPWTGGSSPLDASKAAKQDNIKKYVGYGAFNDLMRDGLIKSGMNAVSAKGWASVSGSTKAGTADAYAIALGIQGKTASSKNIVKDDDPNHAVQYASCHDNYTLFDRITCAYSNDGGKTTTASEDLLKYGPMLANSLVLTSQGTTFMLSGEEFLRTKTKEDGTKDENSYQSSYQVNALDYDRAIEYADVVEYYSDLILLKTVEDGLHHEKENASKIPFEISADNSMITYGFVDAEGNVSDEYKFIAKNGTEGTAKVDLSGYEVFNDSRGIYETGTKLTAETEIQPLQFLILSKVSI